MNLHPHGALSLDAVHNNPYWGGGLLCLSWLPESVLRVEESPVDVNAMNKWENLIADTPTFGGWCRDLFQVELDHHVLRDLPAFGSTILQALEPVLHFGDAALEPSCQGFVGQFRTDDSGDDLVEIRKALHRIGEGLIINLRFFRLEPVTDCAISDGRKLKIYGKLLYLK